MLATVMILANRALAIGGFVIGSLILVQIVLHLIWRREDRRVSRGEAQDAIGTKLRRFRDSKTVRCPRNDCQAWNPRRARYCRICGCGMD